MGNSAICICTNNQGKESISNININELSENENIKNNQNKEKIKSFEDKKLNDNKNGEQKENLNKQKEESEKTSMKKKKIIITENQSIKKSAQSTGIISDTKEKTKIKNLEENNKNEKEEKLENKDKIIVPNKKIFRKKPKSNKTIIICGPNESGKTSFLLRFCEDKFDEFYIPSFQDEIKEKKFMLNHRQKEFILKFIVTNDLNNDFKEEIDCYFVIYDVTDNKSFINAMQLIQDKLNNDKNVIFFIGNKKDLKENINEKEVQNFCDKNKLINMYISVKENIGIVALMQKFSEMFNYD